MFLARHDLERDGLQRAQRDAAAIFRRRLISRCQRAFAGRLHDEVAFESGFGSVLSAAGFETVFHGVNIKPRKPLFFGMRDTVPVFGLPGNPVSAFTGYAVFVAPALRKMSGHRCPEGKPIAVRLAEPLRRRPGRTTYALAHVEVVDGACVARAARSAGSGDVLSLVRANAFLVVPGDPHAIEAGTLVDAVLWDS